MARKYQNFISGTLSIDHQPTDNVMASPGLAALQSIANPDHLIVVFNPEGDDTFSAAPEVVHVVSHGTNSTTATMERAKEGTQARLHKINTPWVAADTAEDWRRVDVVEQIVNGMQLDGWVTAQRLGIGSVTQHKLNQNLLIANGGLQLADGLLGALPDGVGLENSVNGIRLKDGGVTAAKLGSGAVGASQLAAGAVGTAQLADDGVTSAKLAPTISKFRRSASQTLSGPGSAVVNWDVEDLDPDGMHSGSNSTIDIVNAGWYLVDIQLTIDSVGGSQTGAAAVLDVEGVFVAASYIMDIGEFAGASTSKLPITKLMQFSVGDTLTVYYTQSTNPASGSANWAGSTITLMRLS